MILDLPVNSGLLLLNCSVLNDIYCHPTTCNPMVKLNELIELSKIYCEIISDMIKLIGICGSLSSNMSIMTLTIP